jgi:hypothetical protein
MERGKEENLHFEGNGKMHGEYESGKCERKVHAELFFVWWINVCLLALWVLCENMLEIIESKYTMGLAME